MIKGLGLRKNKGKNEAAEQCCREIKEFLTALPEVDPYSTFLLNYNKI